MSRRRELGTVAGWSSSVLFWLPCMALIAMALAACIAPLLMPASAPLLARVAQDVHSGSIVRIQLVSLRNVFTPSRMDPETLELVARGRWNEITLDSATRHSLEEALRRAVIAAQRPASDPEVKGAIIFLDRAGERRHAIYFTPGYRGAAGRDGYVDGRLVTMDSTIADWTEAQPALFHPAILF